MCVKSLFSFTYVVYAICQPVVFEMSLSNICYWRFWRENVEKWDTNVRNGYTDDDNAGELFVAGKRRRRESKHTDDDEWRNEEEASTNLEPTGSVSMKFVFKM